MDKELTEITPSNLGDVEVNTAKRASAEEVKAAAEAEKEEKQNYYVDPLEQDAVMEKRRQELEELRHRTNQDNNEPVKEEETPEIDDTIRPDMNVNGFFSAGQTATKAGIMNRTATKGTLAFCMVFGVINAIYSAFYTVMLVSSAFDLYWLTAWVYAIVFILTIIVLFNSLRSMKSQKDDIKRKALIGVFGSIISFVPLIAWIIHWIITII
jgi:cation transport ATPase